MNAIIPVTQYAVCTAVGWAAHAFSR